MVRNLISFIIVFSIISTAYAEKNPSPISNQKEINHLKNELKIQNKKYDDLLIKFNQLEDKFRTRFSETYSEKLLGGFGVIYTVITVLVSILTLGLPILLYFLGIKPSQDAIKNLEKNFDIRLKEYFLNLREKEVKQAFEGLMSDDHSKRSKALSFFSFTQYQGFTDNHLFKMYTLCKDNCIEFTIRQLFVSILLVNENQLSKELLTNKKYAIEYRVSTFSFIARTGVDDNFEYIKAIIQPSENQMTHLSQLTLNLRAFSKEEDLRKLWNNKSFIKLLTHETKQLIKTKPELYLNQLQNEDLKQEIIKLIK